MFSIGDYIFSILRDVEIFQCASHKVYLAYRRESWNIMLEDPLVQLLILIASLVGLASASHFVINSVEKLIEMTGLSEASAGS